MNAGDNFQVPHGFEAAHEEWLACGGQQFRRKHIIGSRYDYYDTRYWALVRQSVLARDSSTCFRCGGIASYVHHLHYTFRGEDHLHPETLVSICGPCHQIVEYARLADSLLTKIRRRISLCKGFLEDRAGCLTQNAVHVTARLLGYQDELAELEELFATKTPYRNARIKPAEAEAISERFREIRDAHEERAMDLVSGWEGSEKEKAARLLPMLEREIPKVEKFIAKVLAPVSFDGVNRGPLRRNLSAETVADCGEKFSGTEALVVGIKFHRGHLNGIALGERTRLVREPANAYDPNAIRVNLQNGETLGYLTKEFAAVLARQMDAGGDADAQISKIVRDKVYIAVTVAKSGS